MYQHTQILRKHGFPLVCLLLARAVRGAGQRETLRNKSKNNFHFLFGGSGCTIVWSFWALNASTVLVPLALKGKWGGSNPEVHYCWIVCPFIVVFLYTVEEHVFGVCLEGLSQVLFGCSSTMWQYVSSTGRNFTAGPAVAGGESRPLLCVPPSGH